MTFIKEHKLFIVLLMISFCLTIFNRGAYELTSDEYITLNISQGFDVTPYGLKNNQREGLNGVVLSSDYFWKKNTLLNFF